MTGRLAGPDAARAEFVAAVVVTRHLLGAPGREPRRRRLGRPAPSTSSSSWTTASKPETEEVAVGCGLPVAYVPSKAKPGGAGGFALGLLTALALGADWVWCADDDGRPGSPDAARASCWRRPGSAAWPRCRRPVVDKDDPDAAGLPAAPGPALAAIGRPTSAATSSCPGYASLFNGALFRAEHPRGGRACRTCGCSSAATRPRSTAGCMRSGLPLRHDDAGRLPAPAGRRRVRADPRRAGSSAQYPNDDVKRYFTYRNRGYLMAQPGMRWLFPLELVRFGYFFLSRRRPARPAHLAGA